jgi:hypothetical protein
MQHASRNLSYRQLALLADRSHGGNYGLRAQRISLAKQRQTHFALTQPKLGWLDFPAPDDNHAK